MAATLTQERFTGPEWVFGRKFDGILVDAGRNEYSATFAAAYAVRPKCGAPVSAPCTWQEVERGEVGPTTFTLRNMAARIANVGDLWSDMHKAKQSLRRPLAKLS